MRLIAINDGTSKVYLNFLKKVSFPLKAGFIWMLHWPDPCNISASAVNRKEQCCSLLLNPQRLQSHNFSILPGSVDMKPVGQTCDLTPWFCFADQ